MLLASVQFLYEILGVLNGDFMGVPVKTVYYRDHVPIAAFLPPALELQVLNVL